MGEMTTVDMPTVKLISTIVQFSYLFGRHKHRWDRHVGPKQVLLEWSFRQTQEWRVAVPLKIGQVW